MRRKITKSLEVDPTKLLVSAVTIALFSLLLTSGCGTKIGSSQPSSSPTAPSTTSSSNLFFEEALPGNPLLLASNSNSAFKTMTENLTGMATINVTAQKLYDYTLTLSNPSGASPTLNRQEGTSLNLTASTFKAQGGANPSLGRLTITLGGNQTEPLRTFVFQHQINISGILLTSTDQVAIFKAINSAPFATDFLKINYVNKNPEIQRFRISQVRPFPISGVPSQNSGSVGRTNWINVISQKLTTIFQYPEK